MIYVPRCSVFSPSRTFMSGSMTYLIKQRQNVSIFVRNNCCKKEKGKSLISIIKMQMVLLYLGFMLVLCFYQVVKVWLLVWVSCKVLSKI